MRVRNQAFIEISFSSEGFVLHTPDFEAAKAWAGNLAKTATLAVVFAQLYTPDDRDKSKGLHSFAVPIRNPKTMETYPGLPLPPI